ncbi:E3 ubiquitin-protein ligase RSL1-like [Cornus florida]|uniref:E3 ubiquitin-protein ligase RSL1-like n=1 Tax=Cornus florida TaxID=4283 RepID=UPI00289A1C96|nr:E3 ubiquitin-protein ligase RSL1-like [Cornus florida]
MDRMNNCEQNHKSDDDEEKASTFTCKICTEEKLPTSTKKFKNNKICVHSICTDCIAKYIKVNIEEHNPAKIRCPSLFCGQMLDPLSCTRIIPAQLFDKWCDVLCDWTLQGLDTCYCPYRDCSALIVNACGGGVRRSKCPRCKRLFCFRCKQPWHPGYGCEDHQSDSIIEKRNNWMRCPTCKHCVELTEGLIMTLLRCTRQ